MLTLGPNLTVNHVGRSADFFAYDNQPGYYGSAGSGIVNEATLNAGYSGGILTLDDVSFTNKGTIAVSNGDTVSITSHYTSFTNAEGARLSVTSGGAFEISADAWSNAGVVDAGAGGNLVVQYATSNSGILESTGGSLEFQGAVTGTGTATISGGVVDFGATSSIAASFTNTTGTLQLDASSANNGQGYTGSISGFGGQDHMDLGDIAFGANTTLGYAANANNTGGTLTVSDGAHTANLALLGQYSASSFAAAGDGHGGTIITDPPTDQQLQLTQPHA